MWYHKKAEGEVLFWRYFKVYWDHVSKVICKLEMKINYVPGFLLFFFLILQSKTNKQTNETSLSLSGVLDESVTREAFSNGPCVPNPPCERSSLSLRTSKFDFHIWSQNLSLAPLLFLLLLFPALASFKKQFSEIMKGKNELLWVLLVPDFRFFITLTGLHEGFLIITELSLATCGKRRLEMEMTHSHVLQLVRGRGRGSSLLSWQGGG